MAKKQEGKILTDQAKKKFVLFGLVLVELLVAVDVTGVTVLAPVLRKIFDIPEEFAGWVLMAYLIPFCLFMIPIGFLADRRRCPEKIMLVSLLGFSFFSMMCALAGSVWSFMFFRFMKGFCAAGIFTTEFVIIIKYWPSPRRIVEMAVTGLAGGIMIGPLAGALFAGHWQWFFVAGSLVALVAFAGLSQVQKLPPVVIRLADSETGSDCLFLDKFRYLFGLLFWGSFLNFIISACSQGANLIITIHLQETLGKSPMVNGIMLSIIALGMLCSNLLGVGSRLIKNIQAAAWGGSIFFAIALAGLFFSDWTGPTSWIIYGLMGIFLGITLSTVELMSLLPLRTENLAVGNGIVVSAMQAGFAVSAFVPLLYVKLGASSLLALAVLPLSAFIVFLLFCKNVDKHFWQTIQKS